MALSISHSVGSYESGAVNQVPDVMTVQQMLIVADARLPGNGYHPGRPDGKIAKVGARSSTVSAILAFQGRVVGLSNPDGRIDVAGRTWRRLAETYNGPVAAAPATVPTPGTVVPPVPAAGKTVGNIDITFSHGGKIPTETHGLTATHSDMYESTVTLSGAAAGTFRGSIYPDRMEDEEVGGGTKPAKGHLLDGSYDLHIGFHKGGSAGRQGADKLVVATQKIRAGLLVNARVSIPVKSNDPGKTSSRGINVHNGFRRSRGSDGCLTIHPDYWSRFISIFLDAYPNIDDWHALYANTGKKIGTLTIKA